MNFWQELTKPLFILAPMEDVTDTVFRQVVMQTGRPDVFFTEFTNVDGMFSLGEKVVKQRLRFVPEEKPIVAQIWGMKPENYFKAGKVLTDMGFDGIDINMGCPEKSVTSRGACSALINNHALVTEIIHATIEGSEKKIPISVKTRLGFEKLQTVEWIGFLLGFDIDAITIHGRTAAELSKVPAHWDEIGKVVKMRDRYVQHLTALPLPVEKEGRKSPEGNVQIQKKPLIIGNGDILNLEQAKEKVSTHGVDGVMIGRGIFHNPWLFREGIQPENKTVKERLALLLHHVELFEKVWGKEKNYHILKKYFKIYLSNFDGAQEIRMKFMETSTYEEAKKLVDKLVHD